MKKTVLFCTLICFLCAGSISSQGNRDGINNQASLPVTRISLFSSGLAYYEHSGTLNAPSVIALPFRMNAINDALMSLVLNDPSSANPSVHYQSPETLLHSLRSLKIDLSDSPNIAVILDRLRGAEIEISAPSAVSGKILGVEFRPQRVSPYPGSQPAIDAWLSLITDQGIRTFNLSDVGSLNFKDPEIGRDIRRALDMISSSRNSQSRDLMVSLPGNGSRRVSLSYVIPAPVWKVSYRLDLSQGQGASPLFQGWAIVDNDGDSDWNNVELSLVAGRPVSFIQNLYPPYYLHRPTLPLAIAGTAEAETHEPGYSVPSAAPRASMMQAESMADLSMNAERARSSLGGNIAGGVIETARASSAGDQFEFTIKNPVSIDRQTSAMMPLVESPIEARKVLIYAGGNSGLGNSHPRLGAELSNSSGMNLPAGPITVYDGGTFAGDALIEFWNEGEKRLISYGEDLSVTGTAMLASSRTMVSVTVAEGVMTFNQSQEFITNYTFKNNSSVSKPLIIEHPRIAGTILTSPEADEQTQSAYRFSLTLPSERELTVLVLETRPIIERVTLLDLRRDTFLSYASSQEIPARVREALQQAAVLLSAVINAENAVADAEYSRDGLILEQDRIRKNVEAAGNQTHLGQEYLKRLMSLDNNIDDLGKEVENHRAVLRSAEKALADYVNGLNL